MQNTNKHRWQSRDFLAAVGLFLATASVVLWQNAHLTVLWDLSYTLDSSFRICLGQMPYRDFPFVHAPMTFLIQAAIMRLFGRAYLHHVLYAAIVGGLGTVLAWRIVLHSLQGRKQAAWLASLLLALPLTLLGVYSILPLPSYDCDSAFAILVAVFLLQRVIKALHGDDFSYASTKEGLISIEVPEEHPSGAKAQSFRGQSAARLKSCPFKTESSLLPFAAGIATSLPLFFKQNIGLPMLLGAVATMLLLVAFDPAARKSTSTFTAIFAGIASTLIIAALVLHLTAGLKNYYHWTIQFAAQRRLPGLSVMLGIYQQQSLLWMLPCVIAALVLLHCRLAKFQAPRLAALALFAAPFLWTLIALFLTDDADDRADSLLALWPLLLLCSAALTLYQLLRGPRLSALLPATILAAIHGTLLSQQIWGSTYAIWPLVTLLIAEMIAFLATIRLPASVPIKTMPQLVIALTAVIAATFALCGGLYVASEERLSYLHLLDGPAQHATQPELKGMAATGPYLANFEELLRYCAAHIPASDGLILLPGEDPFYFATGRLPQFPVLLFDPSTDPYSTAQLVQEARKRGIRWLIVKRELQIKEDITPDREAAQKALLADFAPYQQLQGYDVYRRKQSEPLNEDFNVFKFQF